VFTMDRFTESTQLNSTTSSASSRNQDAWKMVNILAVIVLVVMGTVYIAKTWSPSSYGWVLVNVLGYADSGPSWGRARPIRSDELAVVTPLTQATINNGFERINRTSLYGEDLRINYGLPIRDWGLIFKPTMWLYGLTNPAYAYSVHWFALSALFIFGYAWLFRWLGAAPVVGFTLAAGLYFTGFVQFWWNEKGPLFALFPWVILPFATRLPLIWRAALFYWLAVVWLLTNFYPPVQVSLAFVGLVILLAREPKLFKPWTMVLLALSAALAAGTAALYLWDYLQATSTTLYPGGRSFSGGSVPGRFWLSWLFPTVNFDRSYESLVGANICEIGTVGMYYFLLVVCFLDFANWRQAWANTEQRRLIVILGIGLTMMLAWMALPLPSWVGVPLLWNNVQPSRMQYAGGLMLLCFLLVLVHTFGLRVSRARFDIFCIAILVGWVISKYDTGKNYLADLALLIVLIIAALAFAFARYRPAAAHASFTMASLMAGILIFGRFNPLQSTWPIFNHPPNQMTKAFDQIAANNGGILAVTGLPGAIANGLGYRSLGHVTAVPKLTFWRKQFPDMPIAKFNMIFNRYSHIIPMAESAPRLHLGDAVVVPVSLFQKPGQVRYLPSPLQSLQLDGYIDRAVIESDELVVSGWGPWTGPLEAHELEVSVTATTFGPPTRSLMIRPDLPPATAQKVSALNGFSLRIPLGTAATVPALCLVAHDASTGKRTLLHNPPDVPYCHQTRSSEK
jgi:hypothetical protein